MDAGVPGGIGGAGGATGGTDPAHGGGARGVDRLILIRHGQTTANVAHVLDTALPGAPLTDLGVTQARRLGRMLLSDVDGLGDLVTSHALRARQTGAGAVAGLHRWAGPGVRLRHADGLHEVAAGDLEGRTDFDAHRTFGELFHGWLHDAPDRPAPGGESGADLLARWLPALSGLIAERGGVAVGADPAEASADVGGTGHGKGSSLAVIGHGAAIRLVSRHLADIDPGFVFANKLPNTSRVELVRDPAAGDDPTAPGSWRLVKWAALDGSDGASVAQRRGDDFGG